MATLETVVEKFGEEMAPYATTLCQHLTDKFWSIKVREGLAGLDTIYPLCWHTLQISKQLDCVR